MGTDIRRNRGKGTLIIKNRFVTIIATGGYVGFLPWAPGTWGSLLGCLLFLPLSLLPLPLQGVVILILIAVGIWVFFFFRAFDIFKPLPQLERIHGGLGVMLDDLFAGVIAHFCVRLVLFLF
jgi:phosphatidylglycerophosphatase A